ncbi:MAG TPA: PqqD family protein [Armatimonadota bacterium]|jgi:hypothetical protein
MDLNSNSVPSRREGVLTQEAEGTLLLLSLDDGQYFSLDEVGQRMWDLCNGVRTVRQIAEALALEYEATADTIEQDALGLLGELKADGLVELVPRPSPAP